jgi:glycerol-3-phosphate O-acyltransferase / dihydroxyacetone phosphate acyltransferase
LRASPPRRPRILCALLRALLRLFFRRVEVVGLERVPAQAPGVLIAWHPNGLLDPALILAHFPRRVVFAARHGLFRWPGLGALMRYLGTVPIFRPQDAGGPQGSEARQEANRRSLEALANEVVAGSFATVFPEGLSHDEPVVQALRPGAARLYLQARERNPAGAAAPVVIPVGLHYDRKNLFGSGALVIFHHPLELPPELAEPSSEPVERERRVGQLTARFGEVLAETVHATDSWELHHLMHRLRKVFRAERAARAGARPGKPSLAERVMGLARVRTAYLERRESHPEETGRLVARVRRYDRLLAALGLEDHQLDRQPDLGSPWRPLALVGQAAGVYLFLPPLLILGYLVNTPVLLLLGAAARRLGGKVKDEASLKLLLGAVALPVVWLAVALLAAWGQLSLHRLDPRVAEAPWLAGTAAFLLCSVGGWVALRYSRLAVETYRALRVRLTRSRRRRTVERLLRERATLYEAALALARGLELPGQLARDGRVSLDPG